MTHDRRFFPRGGQGQFLMIQGVFSNFRKGVLDQTPFLKIQEHPLRHKKLLPESQIFKKRGVWSNPLAHLCLSTCLS